MVQQIEITLKPKRRGSFTADYDGIGTKGSKYAFNL